jgi:hypothetical protein
VLAKALLLPRYKHGSRHPAWLTGGIRDPDQYRKSATRGGDGREAIKKWRRLNLRYRKPQKHKTLTMTWSHPLCCNMFATSFAVIGARLLSFLSCRAYGKRGITAVIRFALAILQAWIMMHISMRLVFTDVYFRSALGRESAPVLII